MASDRLFALSGLCGTANQRCLIISELFAFGAGSVSSVRVCLVGVGKGFAFFFFFSRQEFPV